MTTAEKNEIGNARGCNACPVCGDSQFWKSFHETPYAAERVTGELEDLEGDVTPVFAAGTLSMAVICEPCFAAMPVEQRLPHYLARLDARRAAIAPVALMPIDGKLIPSEADKQRFDAEMARLDAEVAAVTAAVKAGK